MFAVLDKELLPLDSEPHEAVFAIEKLSVAGSAKLGAVIKCRLRAVGAHVIVEGLLVLGFDDLGDLGVGAFFLLGGGVGGGSGVKGFEIC